MADGRKVVKKIEIHLPGGVLLATMVVLEEGLVKTPETGKDEARTQGKGNGGGNGESLMSDAQKRYLFRLLADQGIENDAAHEDLKKRFKTNSLLEVSKFEASREIEKLLVTEKGGASHGH